jgi:excisionase family DNA binding protein
MASVQTGDRLLTTGEAAQLCSVTPDTVLKWIKRGRLEALRTPGGHYRIDHRNIEPLVHPQLTSKETPPPPVECIPQPQRCWEYLSDRGVVREECRNCVVYRVRAAWCFQVLGLGSDVGHAKQFCGTSCEECAYYRRVRGWATNVLVITSDENLIGDLAGDQSESLALRFARNGYEASALIHGFRPAFVVVDEGLIEGSESRLLDWLANDPRVPGLKIILAAPGGMGARSKEDLETGVVSVIEKPFGTGRVLAAISAMPVESLVADGYERREQDTR